MATRVFVTPVGDDLKDISGSTWQIAGVSVDNPSGSWLRIPNVGTVPPWTLGWSIGLAPTITSVSVLFTDSPSGTPSESTGGPVTVTISNVAYPDSPGFPSGGQQTQSPIGAALLPVEALVDADEGGISSTILTPPAGHRIVPLTIMLAAYWDQAQLPYRETRTMIRIQIMDLVAAEVYVYATISPSMPTVFVPFPLGLKLNIDATMTAHAITQPGGGRQSALAQLSYYLQDR